MDNKNNTKKKVIIVILAFVVIAIAILLLLKGCSPKEEPVVHTHSYSINEEGTWICKEDGDILSNTDKPYVATLEDNEPKDIVAIDSLSKNKTNIGNGTIYKDGNNIYYSGNNAQTVIIKTFKVDDKQVDKDNLVINAPNDTVYHYGSSTVVSLDAVATNSFHEYGKVDLITLTKARVVLENPSEVKEIYLDINDTNYSYKTSIIALKEKVELPRLTRDAVDLEEGEVKTLAIVQKLKDEVKTETNEETNEVIETVLEIQTADDDYVKIENVRKSNDELIIEAFLSPNADETDKTQTETQTTSTITLEEAKEGSSHPASKNTFVSKDEKVIEVVKPIEVPKEEPKEEVKPVVTPTVIPQVVPVIEEPEEEPAPVHTHSYGGWYEVDEFKHAKKCSCGDEKKEDHVYGDDDICDVCGYVDAELKITKDGTSDAPIYMKLGDFRDSVNGGNEYEGCTVKVLKDLDYSNESWGSIGDVNADGWFAGIFDGNNKKITLKNKAITEWDFGLFGALIGYSEENRCVIKNLKLIVDFEVSNTNPKCFCGGLVGEIYEFVSIYNVDVEGSIVGNRATGGIVSTIRECREGETVVIEDCNVKANINNYSIYNDDNWLCVGGIIGQSSCVNGTSVINCSYTGTLSTDFTGYENSASSFIGYVMAKGGQDGGDESTIITNFSVGEGSNIVGYQNAATHNYPFEGLNKYTGGNTYSGAPNHNKELLGGYFYKCTINGEIAGGSGQNFYPHGTAQE